MALDFDLVRILYGDTDEANQLLTDEQLELLTTAAGNNFLAAASAADALSAKYSRSVSFTVEGLSIQNGFKAENYAKLADRLRNQSNDYLTGGTLGASVSGVSISEMESVAQDTDRVPNELQSPPFDEDRKNISDPNDPRWQ